MYECKLSHPWRVRRWTADRRASGGGRLWVVEDALCVRKVFRRRVSVASVPLRSVESILLEVGADVTRKQKSRLKNAAIGGLVGGDVGAAYGMFADPGEKVTRTERARLTIWHRRDGELYALVLTGTGTNASAQSDAREVRDACGLPRYALEVREL